MGLVDTIVSAFSSSVIDSLGKAIDSIVTSDEERLKLKNELVNTKLAFELKKASLQQEFEKEISKRWISDNSGNFITKSVRPLTLIYLTIAVTVLALTDGNLKFGDCLELSNLGVCSKYTYEIVIKSEWVEVFKWAYMSVIGAYFTSKGIERVKNRVVG